MISIIITTTQTGFYLSIVSWQKSQNGERAGERSVRPGSLREENVGIVKDPERQTSPQIRKEKSK